MEWLRKLRKAIDYLENNLDGDLSYEEAAQSCVLLHYFQRIFSYVAGIPLSDSSEKYIGGSVLSRLPRLPQQLTDRLNTHQHRAG